MPECSPREARRQKRNLLPAWMVIKSTLVSKLIILNPPLSAAGATAGLDGLNQGAPGPSLAEGESCTVGSEKPPLQA